MLTMNFNVIKGVIVIQLEGYLNSNEINNLEEQLNYLIYKQEMHFFIFDFNNVEEADIGAINNISNKLVEIFLTCGKVILLGVNSLLRMMLGKGERMIYVDQFREAFKYFSI